MSFSRTDLRKSRPKALGAVTIAAVLSIGLDVALTAHDAAVAASTYEVTIARGANVPVAFHAPPNARCELGAMNSPADKRLTAISDAGGTVRFFASTKSTARIAVLATLECISSKAHTMTGLTLIPGASAPQRVSAAPHAPVTLASLATTAHFGVLPGTPAGFDVTTASAAQLAHLHYPPRPDPGQDAMGYAVWRKAMTTPGMYAPAVAVSIPNHRTKVTAAGNSPAGASRIHPALALNDTNATTCGPFILEYTDPMNSIVAEWNVPAVTTYIPGVALSSTTIAENGISGGTEQEAANIPGVGIFSAYYAWYEINGASYAFNIPVGPGDAIWAEASYVTSNLTARYPQDYAFLDYTTSQLTYVPLGAPPVEGSGYFLQWSEERTLGFPLAQFAPFSIWGMAQDFNQNAFALDGSGSDFHAPGAVGGFIPYVQQMTSTGMQAGNLMCTSALASSNVVSLQFVSPF